METMIDVFWYLEEVLIKKDLDNDEWYRIPRSSKLIRNFVTSLREELIGFIQNGESVSYEVASKSVDDFLNEL